MPDDGGQRLVIAVPACLLGVLCNHVVGASRFGTVDRLRVDHVLVPICPEVAGWLPIPRAAVEVQGDGTVVTGDGQDVSDRYRRGPTAVVAVATVTGAKAAVLKARSPSCGCRQVYDGPFTRTHVQAGVTARALRNRSCRSLAGGSGGLMAYPP